MDRIMPIDLENAKLTKSLRGYDTAAVDEMLKRAAETIESLIQENDKLKAQVLAQQERIEKSRSEEGTLKEALVLAQRAADETRAVAHREADLIREEARTQANQERIDLQRTSDALRWDIEKLRVERTRFVEEFRSILERYQREIGTTPALTVLEGQPAAVKTGA